MLNGNSLVGSADVRGSGGFHATDPSTNQRLEPAFGEAGQSEVDRACALAAAAFDDYRESTPDARAQFLSAIATQIEALGDPLIDRVVAESGLPRPRIKGELGRTTGQLNLFADLVRSGRWLDVRIDAALPQRAPPRPELRQRRIALGPVAVFGASNFPLAFSAAGGDTASALAAGCPVVVKGHPAHPGTSEMVGAALRRAVQQCSLPEGVFSLLQGSTKELGAALVSHPAIKAVAFTGSRAGGLALMAIANSRAQPIPVYAEMSSINPVILLPGALAAQPEELARGYVASLTLGAGQFCTNPGLVLAIDGPDLERFLAAATQALSAAPAGTMLSPGIHAAYECGVGALLSRPHVKTWARGLAPGGANGCHAALTSVSAHTYLADHTLWEEVFGASSMVVRCRSIDEIKEILERMEGQLTATLHVDASDTDAARTLLPTLERKVGRILANGWPTGVEVAPAMVHGGPFPATSDGRSTSVGTAAIERFLRPVCYQNLPAELLPVSVRS